LTFLNNIMLWIMWVNKSVFENQVVSCGQKIKRCGQPMIVSTEGLSSKQTFIFFHLSTSTSIITQY
jgi:hypothetical protein